MRYAVTDAPHSGRWSPMSQIGRWAVALAAAAATGVALSVLGFATGAVEAASSFSDNWLLTGSAVAVLVSGAASAFTGAVAIFGRHDRSWSVLLATFVAVCVLALLLNEVAQGM